MIRDQIEALIARAEAAYGLEPGAVRAIGRRHPQLQARAAVVWVLREHTSELRRLTGSGRAGHSNVAIGLLLNREHSSISHLFAVAERLRRKQPAFRELTDRLVRGEPVAQLQPESEPEEPFDLRDAAEHFLLERRVRHCAVPIDDAAVVCTVMGTIQLGRTLRAQLGLAA